MASFTEQATLAVKDASTAEIKKINAALKDLFNTAKSMKGKDIGIRVKALKEAADEVNALKRAFNSANPAAKTTFKMMDDITKALNEQIAALQKAGAKHKETGKVAVAAAAETAKKEVAATQAVKQHTAAIARKTDEQVLAGKIAAQQATRLAQQQSAAARTIRTQTYAIREQRAAIRSNLIEDKKAHAAAVKAKREAAKAAAAEKAARERVPPFAALQTRRMIRELEAERRGEPRRRGRLLQSQLRAEQRVPTAISSKVKTLYQALADKMGKQFVKSASSVPLIKQAIQPWARVHQQAINQALRTTPSGVPAIAQARAPAWGFPAAGGGGGRRPPRTPAAAAAAGRGGGAVGRVATGVLSGIFTGGYGESIPHAVGRAIGLAIKEGTMDADIGETALGLRQLTPERRKFVDQAIDQIEKDQGEISAAQLFNRGHMTRIMAEALGVVREGAAYRKRGLEGSKEAADMAGFLTAQTLSLSNVLFGLGKSFDDAKDGAIRYVKAAESANMLQDEQGKLNKQKAAETFNFFRQLIPTIGEEATGKFIQLNIKYLKSSRFGLAKGDKQGLAVAAFLAEELGTSAAVGMHRFIAQSTAGLGDTKGKAPIGMTKAAYAEQMKYGLQRDKMIESSIGKVTYAQLARERPLEYVQKVLIPALQKKGVDITDPTKVKAVMDRLYSHGNAAEMAMNVVMRVDELADQWEQMLSISGEPKAVKEATAVSVRGAAQAITSQVEGALGQAIVATAPHIIPAFNEIGKVIKAGGDELRKALTGDKAAAERITTGGLLAMIAAPLARPAVAGAMTLMSGIAGPLGMVTGMTAAATAPNAAMRSIAYAGVSLNSAAVAMQGAAAMQMAAAAATAGKDFLGTLKNMLPSLMPYLTPAALGALRAIPGISAVVAAAVVSNELYKPEVMQERKERQATMDDRLTAQNLGRVLANLQMDLTRAKREKRPDKALIADLEAQIKTYSDRLKAVTERLQLQTALVRAIPGARLGQWRTGGEEPIPVKVVRVPGPVIPRMVPGIVPADRFTPTPEGQPPVRTVPVRRTERGIDDPVGQLMEVPSLFDKAFSSGATTLGAAGMTFGSNAIGPIQSGAAAAGTTLGNNAVAAIRAGVSDLNINVNANIQTATAGTDKGGQKAAA